jgi:hypothetical protein
MIQVLLYVYRFRTRDFSHKINPFTRRKVCHVFRHLNDGSYCFCGIRVENQSENRCREKKTFVGN